MRVLLQAEKAAHLLEDVHIALVFCLEYGAVFVPQAQHTVGAVQVTGCAAEFQRFAQVFLQRLTGPVGFKAVQRDADPIQGRALQQLLLPAVQQGAVGGQRHLQPSLSAQLQQSVQLRVQQRLSHQVQVDKVSQRLHLPEQIVELSDGDELRRAAGFGAEAAIQVALAGDFQVSFF